MKTPISISRMGGTAIAAVLALSATPAFAQEVTPQEVPQATAPAEPPAATVTTPAPSVPDTSLEATDPLAAAPAAEAQAAAPATTAKSASASKSAKPATTKSTPRAASTAVKAAAPVAAPAPSVPATPDAAPLDALPAAPLAVAPVVTPQSMEEPVAAPPADDTLPIALGAGLGLLALGGAAFALRRRRRDTVEQDALIVDEPRLARQSPTPLAATPTPAIADRSAFAWGAPAAAASHSAASGRTWVERAHDGPTPENPFLSLKKRLQRAAFYDQRERAVAEGSAKPLSPMAGLPQRFAAAIKPQRTAPAYGYSYAMA